MIRIVLVLVVFVGIISVLNNWAPSLNEPKHIPVVCEVVKFTTVEAEVRSACIVQCTFAYEANSSNAYTTSTPVDCSWYGKKVTRQ